MFSISESAKFIQREQVSEKFRVRVGHGLFRKLVCCAVLGGTLRWDETIGKSAPFFYFHKMKSKTISLFVLLALTLTINAQTESAFVNAEKLLGADAVWTPAAVEAKKVLCSSQNVVMKAAFDDTYKIVPLWDEIDVVNKVDIDGVEYGMPMGLQGQTNPQPNSLLEGGQHSGSVFQFDVKADGILYVFGRYRCNKNYYVWEGDVCNWAAMPMAYTMVAAQAIDGNVVGYTLPSNRDGYYIVGTGYDDGKKYLCADQCTEIYKVKGINAENVPATKSHDMTVWNIDYGDYALGVIAFPVYAKAKEYYVNCCGSKMISNGYVFVKGATKVGNVSFPKYAGDYTKFNFNAPSSLSPSIICSEDENTGIDLVNESFTSDGVSLTFDLGNRTQNYSAREWTNPDFTYQLRVYQGAKIKVEAPSDGCIDYVVFSGSNIKNITSNIESVSNGMWKGNAKEVTFSINEINNKIDNIIVGYSVSKQNLIDGITYSQNKVCPDKDINYTRTFDNTKWQSLYIPFSMSYDDWKDDFDVAYINGIRQYDKNDDGVIDETIMDIVKIKNGSLIPNTPYLIRAKTTGEKTISVTNTTLYIAEQKSIDCSTTLAKYTFTGTYNTISASKLIANNYYAMGGGSLVITDGTSDLKPYRWYLNIESRSPMYNVSNAAKRISINVVGEEDEVTGIEQVQVANDNSPVYDLNGRIVSENGLKAGVYIKNGKKIVIK